MSKTMGFIILFTFLTPFIALILGVRVDNVNYESFLEVNNYKSADVRAFEKHTRFNYREIKESEAVRKRFIKFLEGEDE